MALLGASQERLPAVLEVLLAVHHAAARHSREGGEPELASAALLRLRLHHQMLLLLLLQAAPCASRAPVRRARQRRQPTGHRLPT